MLRRLLGRFDGALLRSLRGTEWAQLTDYVSPSFFEVMPARRIAAQSAALVASAADGAGVAAALRAVGDGLAARQIDLRLTREEPVPLPGPPRDETARRALGQRVLEIYFGQLYASDRALLDLRASRFACGAPAPVWFPRPFWIAWDPPFLAAVRELYRGFYGDDARVFDAALAQLGLSAAREAFRAHFGGEDQRCVRFRAATFHASFHQAFVRCRDAGSQLHPNFLALGISLAALYDHLESLDVPLDVRAAFERAATAP